MSAALLAPLAAVYGAAVEARCALYARGWIHPARAGAPVISVGNLAAGGTGKTPMVAMVARLLGEASLRPAVVSRGYRGRRRRDPLIVSGEAGPLGDVKASQAGDEPVMLARSLPGIPVIVARRRAEGAALAIARFGARCIVLDDGFQHLGLHRDLDLVLLDGRRPLGTERLLPAGLLRESPRALGRAHAIVFTGDGNAAPGARECIARYVRAGTPFFGFRTQPTLLMGSDGPPRPAGEITGRRVVAFAGIARPERFRETLELLGATLQDFLAFPDHHAFGPADVRRILDAAGKHPHDLLLTTEKDLARLEGSDGMRQLRESGLAALRIEGFIHEPERVAFRDLILSAARTPPEGR